MATSSCDREHTSAPTLISGLENIATYHLFQMQQLQYFPPSLLQYILLVALIAISEISAGTISFLYREDIVSSQIIILSKYSILLLLYKNDSLEGRMVDAIEEYRAASDQEGYDRRKEANNAVDYIQERVTII